MRTAFIVLGIILNVFFAVTLWMFLSSDSGEKIERYSLNFFLVMEFCFVLNILMLCIVR